MTDSRQPSPSGLFPRLPLHMQVAIALALSVLVSVFASEGTQLFGVALVDVLNFFSGLFLSALKMVVVPLVVSSIVVGVANMAAQETFGRVGGKTVAFYLFTGIIAVATGLALVNLIGPGRGESAQALRRALPDAAGMLAEVEGRGFADLADVIARAVPDNMVAAAANTELLALIFIGVLFGYSMARLDGRPGEVLRSFWQGIHDVMIRITLWIMRFAPIGVFALVTKTLLSAGMGSLGALAWFFVTVLAALAVHFAVTLPLLQRLFAGIRPSVYYRYILPAQLTAFSTASSSVTLPVTLNCAEQAGISKRTTGFVLPLGATVNMDGTALYECVVVVFIAQIYGIELGAAQILVVALALLTSIGVAGIPSASLVAIVLILPVVGLPVEALAVVLAVDRLLDMARTAVNVTSDLTVTALIARSEGEPLPTIRAAPAIEASS